MNPIRLIALCCLAAFVSLLQQWEGLYSPTGVTPLPSDGSSSSSSSSRLPFSLSSLAMWLGVRPWEAGEVLLVLGAGLSFLATVSYSTVSPFLFLSFFFLYLLLFDAGSSSLFLAFQWDLLLLEVCALTAAAQLGLKAMQAEHRARVVRWVSDPWGIPFSFYWLRSLASEAFRRLVLVVSCGNCGRKRKGTLPNPPPPTLRSLRYLTTHAGAQLFRLLAVKLIFASGWHKIAAKCGGGSGGGGDANSNSWLTLTANEVHFASQCIPTPVAYFAHNLPPGLLHLSVAVTLWVMMPGVLLFLAPAKFFPFLRRIAVGIQVAMQLLIMATGNYNFFNVLTIALLLMCLPWAHRRRTTAGEKGAFGRILCGCGRVRVGGGPANQNQNQQQQQQRGWQVVQGAIFVVYLLFTWSWMFDLDDSTPLFSGPWWAFPSGRISLSPNLLKDSLRNEVVDTLLVWSVLWMGVSFASSLIVDVVGFFRPMSSSLRAVSAIGPQPGPRPPSRQGGRGGGRMSERPEPPPPPTPPPTTFEIVASFLLSALSRVRRNLSTLCRLVVFLFSAFFLCCLFLLSAHSFLSMRPQALQRIQYGREFAESLSHRLAPYHLSGSYGLFRCMTGEGPTSPPEDGGRGGARFVDTNGLAITTTARPEVVLEGLWPANQLRAGARGRAPSDSDELVWAEIPWPYKPGNPSRPPPWVAPHQPRLDWQAWFAALAPNYQHAPWLVQLASLLVEGSPPALALFDGDAWPARIRAKAPSSSSATGVKGEWLLIAPLAVRGKLYRYDFVRDVSSPWGQERHKAVTQSLYPSDPTLYGGGGGGGGAQARKRKGRYGDDAEGGVAVRSPPHPITASMWDFLSFVEARAFEAAGVDGARVWEGLGVLTHFSSSSSSSSSSGDKDGAAAARRANSRAPASPWWRRTIVNEVFLPAIERGVATNSSTPVYNFLHHYNWQGSAAKVAKLYGSSGGEGAKNNAGGLFTSCESAAKRAARYAAQKGYPQVQRRRNPAEGEVGGEVGGEAGGEDESLLEAATALASAIAGGDSPLFSSSGSLWETMADFVRKLVAASRGGEGAASAASSLRAAAGAVAGKAASSAFSSVLNVTLPRVVVPLSTLGCRLRVAAREYALLPSPGAVVSIPLPSKKGKRRRDGEEDGEEGQGEDGAGGGGRGASDEDDDDEDEEDARRRWTGPSSTAKSQSPVLAVHVGGWGTRRAAAAAAAAEGVEAWKLPPTFRHSPWWVAFFVALLFTVLTGN